MEEAAERTLSALQRARSEAALRESEERQRLLLHLSDTLRPLTDAADIEKRATRLLGERLQADRCFLTLVDDDGERLYVREEHLRSGASSVLGDYTFAQFGDFVGPALHAGRILAVEDVAALPDLAPAERASYAAVGIAAYLLIPLVRDGRLAAYLTVNHRTPRSWSDADQSIARQTADRAWEAIEGARAESELRESEERQAFLLKLSDELRSLTDPMDVQERTSVLLGEELGVDNACYGAIDDVTEMVVVAREFRRDSAVSMIGDHRFADFDWALRSIRAGRNLVMDAAGASDAIPDAQRAPTAALGVSSFVVAPLFKGGRLIASLAVLSKAPRHWSPDEIRKVEESLERTWEAVERARAEAALHDGEERFRQFGEASQDVLWIRDAGSLQWEYLTPAFETIYGLDRATALSGDNMARWAELIVLEDRERALANVRKVRDGEWVTFEYRIRRPSDGRVRWLRNTDFPMRDPAGRIVRIGGVGHDVTEVKEAEAALEAAERRQRALVEGIAQLVWRAVDGGRWTWASPQWTAFTGQAEGDSHGFGRLERVHSDDRETTMAAWSRAIETGEFDGEYRLRRRDGAYRWFSTRATPVRDEAGAILEWLGTSTDIHELRRLQERQGVLVAELQHRTRNLIGVVRSLADRTADSAASLPDFEERFGRRLSALSRVQGLLSHLSAGQRVTFDKLLRAELTAHGALDGAARRVTLDGPCDVPLRSGTVQTFALALHELATNAVKYGALAASNPDGLLTIGWRVEPPVDGGRPRLHVDWRESGVPIPDTDAPARGGGYGRELIERALPYQLDAETSYELGADGVRCTIVVPIAGKDGPELGT